jgi:hypothetical protein
MSYKTPFFMDQIVSDFEDFLTFNAIIPFLGSAPALLKALMGLIQIICAAIILATLTFFLMSDLAQEICLHSLRHIIHGFSNVFSGLLLSIPIIGSLAIIGFGLRNAHYSDRSGSYLKNSQSHKFFAYKTIEDSSWVKIKNDGYDTVEKLDYIPADRGDCSAVFSL